MPVATFVYDNAYLVINGTDLSDQLKAVALKRGNESVDDTRQGHTNRVKKSGIDNWSLTITFAQNFDAGKVHATLKPLFGRGSPSGFPIILRADNAPRLASNPEMQMTGILSDYTPIGFGGPGEYALAPISIENASAISEFSTPS